MALFPRPPGWAGARRELLDFMVQGKINRGRHTDHPAGRHSIRTNQYPPPLSPSFFTGRMPFLPPNQQCQSTEDNFESSKQCKSLISSSHISASLQFTVLIQSIECLVIYRHWLRWSKVVCCLMIDSTRLNVSSNKSLLVSWSLTSLFSTNTAISETKGQGWRVILIQWRKASDILTSTLAAFLFSSHPKKGKGIERLI